MDISSIADKIASDIYNPSSRFCAAVVRYNLGRFSSDEEEEMTEKEVKRGLMGCLKFGLTSSLKDIVNKARGLRGNKIPWKSVIRHIWEEIKEKVSIRKVAKDIWQIARKKGWKFAVVAILLEMFEDIVLPGLAIVLGHPELAPMFLALHLEPIVYPIAMCILQ